MFEQEKLLAHIKKNVGPPFGLVADLFPSKFEDKGYSYFLYRARINSINYSGWAAPAFSTFGFDGDESLAELKAFCEAIERFCGANYRANGHAKYERWSLVKDEAIEPKDFIGYSDVQYSSKNFPCTPLDENRSHYWIPAIQESDSSSKLVHIDLVRMASQSRLVRTSSIGMAVHTEKSQAKISATLELIERDHLALAFWRGEPGYSLDADDLSDRTKLHLESMRSDGYHVHCIALNYGLDIPVILWLAFRDKKLPFFLKGAAASLSVLSAKEKAFDELFRSFLYYRENKFEVPSNPQGVLKNLAYYQTPDVMSRLDFLISGRSLDFACKQIDPINFYEHLKSKGISIFTVDMGCEITEAVGLHCVRALSPELVRTPLGNEAWQLASPRLRSISNKRDLEMASNHTLHFFS